MNNRLKKIGVTAFVAGLIMMMTVPVYAAASSRKKITGVKITIESNILPETDMGEEEIEITVPKSAKYEYDSYEILNSGAEWDMTMTPEIKITLTAKENYYFSLKKASAVSIKGATYVKAEKQDSSSLLLVTVKLPSLEESIGELGDVMLTEGGYVYWDSIPGAGNYDIRIYRNGSAMNNTEIVTAETVNSIQDRIKREGDYSVKVRARNKVKEEKKTEWVESNNIYFNTEMVQHIKEGKAPELPKKGEWKQTEDNRWQYVYEDGSFVVNEWKKLENKWYFFDEEGFMRTGWIEWDGKEYYCDERTGAMLTNTTTPDGYEVRGDGSKILW